MSTNAYRQFDSEVLTAVTADESISAAFYTFGAQAVTVYITGSGTISSGALAIEEAPTKESATWSTVTTYDPTALTGGGTAAIHLGGPGGNFAYAWLRVRVSTAIGGGGNITARLVMS